MIQWSGQNWYQRANGYTQSINVIEKPSESYDAYHERKKRTENARTVPFGFARALKDEDE